MANDLFESWNDFQQTDNNFVSMFQMNVFMYI